MGWEFPCGTLGACFCDSSHNIFGGDPRQARVSFYLEK